MLIDLEQLDLVEQRYNDELPLGKPVLNSSKKLSDSLHAEEVMGLQQGPTFISKEKNTEKRKEKIKAANLEPFEFAYERSIGKNDSVYSNFVELIHNAKRNVGRIVMLEGIRNHGFATGFMVAENLMMTNWHVFKEASDVGDSEIQFGYEYDTNGRGKDPVCFKLDIATCFHVNKELDYCLVGIKPMDITNQHSLSSFGYTYLDPEVGKLGNEEEALNIIHHPEGDYQQLSIRENIFKKISAKTIWYSTDTAQGSSGSPVYNDQWQVVALHHMGVGKKNDKLEYVDKDGIPIPIINGKIDEKKVVWIANEGIRTSVILNDIFSTFPNEHPIVLELKKKPNNSPVQTPVTTDNLSKSIASYLPQNELSNMEKNNLNEHVNISIPSSLIASNGTVTIHIDTRSSQHVQASEKAETHEAYNFNEIKKLETSTDYSSCKGYASNFLGIEVPLPEPMTKIKKFIAKMDTGGTELKYYHFSVMQHSVRKMPIISAINVDGSSSLRKDKTARKDSWLRDTRLDFDLQLNDSFYKRSGFDRGHMSRREDANFGATPEEAKRNADLTCVYTNACPQVAALNQSKAQGLWGKLEKIVLETGAMEEKGKLALMSVFNGPIFRETDPVFRGIQIPMEFFKIILWLTDKKELRATAFKLSQVDLVGDISFEQLDIDKDIEFLTYQVSVNYIQKNTGLKFSDNVIDADTFSTEEEDGSEILTTEEMVKTAFNYG